MDNGAHGQGVVGDPLLAGSQSVDGFEIQIDARPYLYTAASHRPLVRGITLKNRRWTPNCDELVISIESDGPSGPGLVHRWKVAIPARSIGEGLSLDRDLLDRIRPNLNRIASLDEAEIGDLIVRVHADGTLIGEARHRIDFLAYNQWMHVPSDYDCLSAFVFPNHVLISEIMDRVRLRLKAQTGDGATSGYQPFREGYENGVKRNLMVLKAIFEELQELDLEYSNPPASFEGYGQKVRTPDIILREKTATCLDSTVLAASCIAAAGLSPLIFIVQGHAFPGVLLSPSNCLDANGERAVDGPSPSRPSVLTSVNVAQIMNGHLMFASFESTNICRSLKEPFDVAINRHQDFIGGAGAGQFKAIVDVERAAECGVRRLPNRLLQDGAYMATEDTEAFRIERAESTLYEFQDSNTADHAREKLVVNDVPPRIRRWMDALLNIENSNLLINFDPTEAFLPIKTKKRSTQRVIRLPLAHGVLAVVENRLQSGKTVHATCVHNLPSDFLSDPSEQNQTSSATTHGIVPLAPVDLSSQVIQKWETDLREAGLTPADAARLAQATFAKDHESEATRRFRALKKIADETEAESATNQLFLTVGTLIWTSPGEAGRGAKEVRSPLFLMPVRLKGSASSSFQITLEDGGEISPNYCLIEKLRSELRLHIKELETPNLDESGIDVDDMIRAIRLEISNRKLPDMRVEEECSLAVLDFATFRMWKDIQKNWKLFERNSVVKHLVEGTNATLDENLDEYAGEVMAPFECDESQLRAVKWSLAGRSFVLEGPPGTGKSQTIANTIAAAMAAGKKILFVAEKKVALEAVSKRLAQIGLDPFCIEMHHEGTTADSIRKQLQQSLDFVGRDVSAQWSSETLVLESLCADLEAYRDSIISENPLGDNAHRAVQAKYRLGDGNGLPVDQSAIPHLVDHLAAVRSALFRMRGIVGASRVTPIPEWELVTQSEQASIDVHALGDFVDLLYATVAQSSRLRPLIEPLLRGSTEEGLHPSARQAIELAAIGGYIAASDAVAITEPSWIAGIESLAKKVDSHRSTHKKANDFFDSTAFQVDISLHMAAATEAISANVFSRRRKAETLRSLVAPLVKAPVTEEPAQILTLLQCIAPAKESLRQINDGFRAITHLTLRGDFDPLNSGHVSELMSAARELVDRAKTCLAPEASPVSDAIDRGERFESSDVVTIGDIVRTWSSFKSVLKVTAESEATWRGGRELWDAINESLSTWRSDSPSFVELLGMVRVNEAVQPLRDAALHSIAAGITGGTLALDTLYDDFERGLALVSIRETFASGALQTFDSTAIEKRVGEYTRHEKIRRELMRTVIPRQLSDSRPFKSGIRIGAIGELERELGRQVRKVSIPALIKKHGEMITTLAPCFLMSPETVSRLLPAESQFFDIVIFDEASQIRVAAAIPAMGRAKSVVVVGDSKQMPPSKRVGQKQAASDQESTLDDDGVLQDLESILSECRESGLKPVDLQCHFRSQHEGLISFSNRAFYEDRLVTYPAPNTDKTSPIYWFPVPNGRFYRSGEFKGSNPEEAAAIVEEICRRLNSPEHSSKSIGVVTFNEHQADHIYELLEARRSTDPALSAALDHPDDSKRLFVVALEKVQGDERDTIMLSVSYSYQDDARTKVSPTWGPLTYKGGERRLNVAITRAKQDLLVFCSFNPDHVNTENSAYEGVPKTVAFLKQCRDSSQGGFSALTARDAVDIDLYRRDLFERLRSSGIKVRENVGLSRFRIDLAISDETGADQFLAILLDNEEWASRSTPFDREIQPSSALRIVGWRRVGRVWLKSSVEDPASVVTIVQNELRRDALRRLLIDRLRVAGLEIRDDRSLSSQGVDFALRKSSDRRWPLAISIHGTGLFPQFLTYEGEVPRGTLLTELNCVSAKAVWIDNLESNLDSVVQDLVLEVDRVSEQAKFDDPVETVSSTQVVDSSSTHAAVSESAETAVLLQSEYWSEFSDARTLPAAGDASILGPGVEYNPAVIKRIVDEVVEFEGPISIDRLASVVAGRFGLERVRAARRESLVKHFSHLPKTETSLGTTFWSSSRPSDSWTGFRTSKSDDSRSIDDVPPEELRNAMVAAVRLGNTATGEEIIKLVASAYGRKAITKVLRERLTGVLDWTVETGHLDFDVGLYKMP